MSKKCILSDRLRINKYKERKLYMKNETAARYPWLRTKAKKWTMLNNLPKGWRKTFVTDFQEELKTTLEDTGLIDDYRVFDCKEKYGQLEWDDFYGCKETDIIVAKYKELSANICAGCGKPDVPMTDHKGWIMPLCEDCFHGTHEEYMKAIEKSPLRMADAIEFEGEQIDIKGTADNIRKNWEEINGKIL